MRDQRDVRHQAVDNSTEKEASQSGNKTISNAKKVKEAINKSKAKEK